MELELEIELESELELELEPEFELENWKQNENSDVNMSIRIKISIIVARRMRNIATHPIRHYNNGVISITIFFNTLEVTILITISVPISVKKHKTGCRNVGKEENCSSGDLLSS